MLSKKTQYAFKALMYMAQAEKEGPILIAEISRKKKIPLKFLENILLELKNVGILDSKKGKGGGYFLKQDPSKVKMATIIRLVNGPISMLPCVSLYFYERCKNCNEKKCALHDIMIEVRDATLQVVDNRTLLDLID